VVDFRITKWHHHKLWNSMAWIFSIDKIIILNFPNLKHMTNNVWIFDSFKNGCKNKPICKCYTYGQRMNMYMLIVYIIHGPFGDIMLSHDFQLNVRCNFHLCNYVILVVNVGCNYFIIANWSDNLTIFLQHITKIYWGYLLYNHVIELFFVNINPYY